jgi:secreted trypsin-like serine protease
MNIKSVIVSIGLVLVIPIFTANAQGTPGKRTLDSMELRGSQDYQDTAAAFLKGDTSKVVGGKVAPDGAYPWQVALLVSWIANPVQAHFCGGSIYNTHWIVTAAHCVIENEPRDIHVVAGTNKLTAHVERANVRRIVVHRDYNKPKKHDNDVALLELFRPLVFNDRIGAIELLSPADESRLTGAGQQLTVTGWGATQEGGSPVRDLRFVDIPPVPREKCNERPSYNRRVTENMICAGNSIGDSCQGDSGGPLITDKRSGAIRLAGLVSWGEGCAQFAKYGVYTRVVRYNEWIAKCTSNPGTC